MKKIKEFLPLVVIVLVVGAYAVTPVSSIGSDPYFSTSLFPQDLLLRQGNYLFYHLNYQNSPWWGDIDEPTNKPTTGDYTVTGVDITQNNASFKHYGSMNTIVNNLGYAFSFRDDLMTSLEFEYGIDALNNYAKGTMTGDSIYTEAAHGTIPFDYSNRHTFNHFSLQGMLGTMFRNYPCGLKFNLGFENTVSLNKELSFSKLEKIDNTTYDSSHYIDYHYVNDQARALWGWSTRGCNHIFGTRETQGDSWLQNEYAIGPLYHFDLLGGITLPKIKAGAYYRYKGGHQDQYYWRADTVRMADSVVSRNFIGRYEKQNMSRIKSAWEGRLFGNINHRSGDRYALNTFVSAGFIDSTTGRALAENLDVENDSREAIRSVALEVDPNINIRLGKALHYVDAALLFEYRYSRYSNTFDDWVAGGRQNTYWNSSVDIGDETVWEDFSYANENRLALGANASMMFPLYSSGFQHLGLGLMFLGSLQFTSQTKYYGANSDNGSELTFSVNNRRENYKRELWFNSFLMLHYMQGPFQLRMELTEPILYSILPRTRVLDKNGKTILFEHEKSPLWVSQKGMQVAIYASYNILPSFLKHLQRGS